MAASSFIAEWREAMACPEFELCSPDEPPLLKLFDQAIYRAECNGDPGYCPLFVEAARYDTKLPLCVAVQQKLKTLNGINAVTLIAIRKNTALNSTGGCHERIRLCPWRSH